MRGNHTIRQRIRDELSSWPGVTADEADGVLAFKLGLREIGHLHGEREAHFGFPRAVGAELRRQGRVGPHPVDPSSTGWAARRIRDDRDIEAVIALLRLNYDRLVARHGVPTEQSAVMH